jgi:hypothetical protein
LDVRTQLPITPIRRFGASGHTRKNSRYREQRGRHCEAERLGGLEVDHQLVFGRRLHRQICRLLTLEDTIDVAGGAPELIEIVSPVGDQAAFGAEVAFVKDRGQLVPCRKRDDQIAMNHHQRARRHDQAAI